MTEENEKKPKEENWDKIFRKMFGIKTPKELAKKRDSEYYKLIHTTSIDKIWIEDGIIKSQSSPRTPEIVIKELSYRWNEWTTS